MGLQQETLGIATLGLTSDVTTYIATLLQWSVMELKASPRDKSIRIAAHGIPLTSSSKRYEAGGDWEGETPIGAEIASFTILAMVEQFNTMYFVHRIVMYKAMVKTRIIPLRNNCLNSKDGN